MLAAAPPPPPVAPVTEARLLGELRVRSEDHSLLSLRARSSRVPCTGGGRLTLSVTKVPRGERRPPEGPRLRPSASTAAEAARRSTLTAVELVLPVRAPSGSCGSTMVSSSSSSSSSCWCSAAAAATTLSRSPTDAAPPRRATARAAFRAAFRAARATVAPSAGALSEAALFEAELGCCAAAVGAFCVGGADCALFPNSYECTS